MYARLYVAVFPATLVPKDGGYLEPRRSRKRLLLFFSDRDSILKKLSIIFEILYSDWAGVHRDDIMKYIFGPRPCFLAHNSYNF